MIVATVTEEELMRLSGVCVDALVALLREEDLIVVCVSRCCKKMLDLGHCVWTLRVSSYYSAFEKIATRRAHQTVQQKLLQSGCKKTNLHSKKIQSIVKNRTSTTELNNCQ